MLIEAIKTFGSIVGLATGLFVLWERLWKAQPVAYLDPRNPTGYQGAGKDIFLVIVNPSDRPIFIDIPEEISGLRFLESRSIRDGIRSGIRVTSGEPLRVVVSAKATDEIELSSPSLSEPADGDVRLALTWRPAHVSRWDVGGLLRRPVVIRTSFQDLRRMRGVSDLD